MRDLFYVFSFLSKTHTMLERLRISKLCIDNVTLIN